MKRPSSSRGGAKPKDIDAYLASLPAKVRSGLRKLRKAMRAAAPEAEEGFSYGMPAFRFEGRPLMGFAAATHHSSLYPMSAAVIRAHAAALTKYETSKGTIRFPHDSPPPPRLVTKLVRARIAELRKPRQ